MSYKSRLVYFTKPLKLPCFDKKQDTSRFTAHYFLVLLLVSLNRVCPCFKSCTFTTKSYSCGLCETRSFYWRISRKTPQISYQGCTKSRNRSVDSWACTKICSPAMLMPLDQQKLKRKRDRGRPWTVANISWRRSCKYIRRSEKCITKNSRKKGGGSSWCGWRQLTAWACTTNLVIINLFFLELALYNFFAAVFGICLWLARFYYMLGEKCTFISLSIKQIDLSEAYIMAR